MTKEELIELVKLEYGKAEDYFGLAASCGFKETIADSKELCLSYRWPLYSAIKFWTPMFNYEMTELEVKMAIWRSVISNYQCT